jgi:alpha-L-fucosidase
MTSVTAFEYERLTLQLPIMREVPMAGFRLMQRTISITFLLSVLPMVVVAQQIQNVSGITKGRDEAAVEDALATWWTASMKNHEQRIAWWREAQFGCFIHWGAYSTFGGEWNGKPFKGYAEHMMRIQKIPRSEYASKVVSIFNPVKFNADEWVNLIKAAGMRYVIITAKHHDGFAMYPSAVSKYNIRNATPFRRDPMRELADACKRAGIRFGFYYSHAFDWEDPNAPGNDWDYDNPAGDKGLHGGLTWFDQHPELLPTAQRYVDEKAIPQITELLKNYHPDILWFDTPSKLPLSENLRILKAVRAVDQTVVINGRLARGLGYSFGDYKNTGDRAAEIVPTDGDWETIPTTNESYGYHKFDLSHKPVGHFIQLMAKAAARGGNVLMNIGPMGDGLIDQKDQEILLGIGKWLTVNGDSIYDSERTPLPVQAWGESTVKRNKIFLHVFDWPRDGKLIVGGLKNQIDKVYLLSDVQKKSLQASRLNDSDLVIRVPRRVPDSADTIVVVEVNGQIRTNPTRLLSVKQPNVLRTFDAELQGSGLRYGDGKSFRAYVFEWRQLDQWVRWQVRLNTPAEYEVALKYTTGSKENVGIYEVAVGDKKLRATVQPTPNENESKTVSLGPVRLGPGAHEIAVRPVEIKGGELMRLFHVSLTPVHK